MRHTILECAVRARVPVTQSALMDLQRGESVSQELLQMYSAITLPFLGPMRDFICTYRGMYKSRNESSIFGCDYFHHNNTDAQLRDTGRDFSLILCGRINSTPRSRLCDDANYAQLFKFSPNIVA
jgi:hypothetical protein